MPRPSTRVLQPRKTPVQARSAASVEAILEATLQVLLTVGKERLTTTRVAARAGVSVGTLYQYFPNKSALLQACLRRHMAEVSGAIEQTCALHRSASLLAMGTALISAYLNAKLRDVKASATLYSVSADLDGAAIRKLAAARSRRAVVAMLSTAKEGLTKDPEVVAAVMLAALNGVAQRLLEAKHPERQAEALRQELVVMLHAYLRTCAATSTATATATATAKIP